MGSAILWATAVLLVWALSGCGDSPVAARVGPTTISEATLDHWAAIAKRERPVSQSSARRQALEFLIFSDWLIEEASNRHLSPTSAQISQRLEATRTVLIDGSESSYIRKLKASGRTAADLRLEVETELAYEHLGETIESAASNVSLAEVEAYYRAHPSSFVVSERRKFDIDNLKSDAAARKVKAEVQAGRNLAAIGLHEEVERATAFAYPGKVAIERAILAAKPGELKGPYVIEPFKLHSIFIVRKIEPARPETLDEAKAKIEALVRKSNQQRALASFSASWRSRWLAMTDCKALVVQRCKQFRGAARPPGSFTIEATGLAAAERPSLPG